METAFHFLCGRNAADVMSYQGLCSSLFLHTLAIGLQALYPYGAILNVCFTGFRLSGS